MRRVSARMLDSLSRLEMDGHLYFHTMDARPDPFRGPGAPRALLVFLCPAEGPQTPADWSLLRRVMQGHGIGQYGVVYLFTAMGVKALDLPDHPAPVGPLADSTLSAAVRWVERPWRERGGNGKSGHVLLCHGQPWREGARRGQKLEDRRAVLWSALRTFKHPAFKVGAGVNPLTAPPAVDTRRSHERFGPDGLPGASPDLSSVPVRFPLAPCNTDASKGRRGAGALTRGTRTMDTAAPTPEATADEAPAVAKKARTYGSRACAECGVKFVAGHPGAQFCAPAHKTAFHNRQKGRASVVMLAMAYRQKRGGKGTGATAFKEMCRLLDLFNDEDRKAGRPSAASYVEGLKRRDVINTGWEARAHYGRGE